MDIQVNMTNIKPDPWGQAKDKLYKCPHCETAFARRQYLRLVSLSVGRVILVVLDQEEFWCDLS